MKYKKGTRLLAGEETVCYVDDFYDEEEDTLILVCDSGCGHFHYIPEDEVTEIESTNEEKMVNILSNMSATMIKLNQNIEDMQEAIFSKDECDCEDCNVDEPTDELDIN